MQLKKLTLEQAHKSGRQFRKEGTQTWMTLQDLKQLSGEEAFANIWETKEKEAFTRNEVERLIRKTIKKVDKAHEYDSLKRAELTIEIMAGAE